MADNLDFTRSVNINIAIAEDRLFDAIIDFSRDDGVAVDFTAKDIKMDIFNKSETLKQTLVSGTEITILVDRLSFNTIITDLDDTNKIYQDNKKYYFRLYNDTDKIGIAWGQLIVEWG